MVITIIPKQRQKAKIKIHISFADNSTKADVYVYKLQYNNLKNNNNNENGGSQLAKLLVAN